MTKKQRGAQPGHIVTEATRKKMSESRKGRILTAEHRQKISATMMGHSDTELTRKRKSEKAKLRWERTRIEKEELKKMEEFERKLDLIEKEL